MLTSSDQSDCEELSILKGEAGDSEWDSTAASDSNVPHKPVLKQPNVKVRRSASWALIVLMVHVEGDSAERHRGQQGWS